MVLPYSAASRTGEIRDWFIFRVARAQCGVVMDVFLGAQSVAWPDKYRPAVCCDSSDRGQLCSYRSAGGFFSAATDHMGRLRKRAKHRDLAAKLDVRHCVRFWPKADIRFCVAHVCFRG